MIRNTLKYDGALPVIVNLLVLMSEKLSCLLKLDLVLSRNRFTKFIFFLFSVLEDLKDFYHCF